MWITAYVSASADVGYYFTHSHIHHYGVLNIAEYFKGIESVDEIPEELKQWLSQDELERLIDDMPEWAKEYDLDTLRQMFKERLEEQNEKHDGGNYWVGTGGTSPFGHGGYNPAGIRVGGTGRHQSAIQIAGERNFRDFRQDNELDTRQFQMAFRIWRIKDDEDDKGNDLRRSS